MKTETYSAPTPRTAETALTLRLWLAPHEAAVEQTQPFLREIIARLTTQDYKAGPFNHAQVTGVEVLMPVHRDEEAAPAAARHPREGTAGTRDARAVPRGVGGCEPEAEANEGGKVNKIYTPAMPAEDESHVMVRVYVTPRVAASRHFEAAAKLIKDALTDAQFGGKSDCRVSRVEIPGLIPVDVVSGPVGWVCPKCDAGVAPHIPRCPCRKQ